MLDSKNTYELRLQASVLPGKNHNDQPIYALKASQKYFFHCHNDILLYVHTVTVSGIYY